MRVRTPALALVALAGCGHGRAAPDVAARPDPARPAWRAPSGLALPASPARAVGVEDERDGLRVVLAGRRAEVHGRSVRWGEGSFATPIVAAHHAHAGWIFVAEDGAVARARSFAGVLEPIGALGPVRSIAPTSDGRAAFVLDGQLYTSDGSATLTAAARDVSGRRFVAASFADERTGAALLDDGSLATTSDGGRSFRRVAVPRDDARELVLLDGRVHVEPRAGAWRSLEGDALVALDPHGADLFAAPVVVPDVAQRVLLASLLTREGLLVASRDVEALASASSGQRWSVVARDREQVVVSDGASTLFAGATSEPTREPCAPIAVRDGALYARCATARGWSLERRGSTAARRIEAVGQAPVALLVADDGLRAAWAGRCDGRDDPARACVATLALPGALREVRLPAERIELVALRGDALLARVRVAGRAQPCVVALGSGAARVALWPRPPGAPGDVQADRVGWSDDGRLFGFAAGSGYGFVEDTAGGALRTIALPVGAVALAFGDAMHGVAAGDTLADLFVTRDGGRSFVRVAAPPGVDPGAVRLGDPLHRSELACDAAGCTVGGAVHLDGYASALDARGSIVRRDELPAIGPATRVAGTGPGAPAAATPVCAPERDAPGPPAFGPLRFECARR